MYARKILIGLFVGCMSVGVVSCAPASVSIPVREMPAGASFSGRWHSNFGEMKLTQKSDGVTRGTFDFKGGSNTIEGRADGGVLRFEWVQAGDFQVGRREVRGRGYLVISDDGQAFTGKWGYGANETGGGEWTGTKAPDNYR